MEYLELKVLPESPTVIRNDSDDVIATVSVSGVGELAAKRTKHIAGVVNGYTILVDALIQVFAEMDREEFDVAKRIATEAYYKATKGVKYG